MDKELISKYKKQWRQNNIERLLEKQKQWRLNNSEYIKIYNQQYYLNNHNPEYSKQYRKNNQEKINEKIKQWRKNNPEKDRKARQRFQKNNPRYYKEYYKNNREEILEFHRNWYKTEKGKALAQKDNIKRRTKMKKIINTLTSQEWLDILEKYNYVCAYCGVEFDCENLPTRDHIIPISKGGNNVKENIVPTCRSCNSKKYNKIK